MKYSLASGCADRAIVVRKSVRMSSLFMIGKIILILEIYDHRVILWFEIQCVRKGFYSDKDALFYCCFGNG